MESQSNMEISKITLFEDNTSRVSNPMQRSYEISGDGRSMRNLENLIDKFQLRKGHGITENTIATALPGIISVGAHSTGSIFMPEGWNTRRLSFVIEVKITVSSSKKTIEYVQGYTDYFDPPGTIRDGDSIKRIVGRGVRWYINSITSVDLIAGRDGIIHKKKGARVNIIKSHDGVEYEIETVNNVKARPSDIIEDLFFSTSSNGNYQHDDRVMDEPDTTNRSNSTSVGFFADTFNKASATLASDLIANEEKAGNKDLLSLQSMAQGLASKNLTDFAFMYYLHKETQEIRPSSFDLGLLEVLAPHLDHITTYIPTKDVRKDDLLMSRVIGGDYNSNILTTNDLDDTRQPTIENLVTVEFMHLMTNAMLNELITKGSIYLSNDPSKVIEDVGEFLNGESMFNPIFATREEFVRLSAYLREVVLSKLTYAGDIYIDIVADIDLLGNSSISTTVNMGEPYVSRYNSSADGLYSPHISSAGGKRATVNDIAALIDTIKDI